MKITIAYLPNEYHEYRNAVLIKAFVEGLISGIKVRESDRHAPFKHIYLTAKRPVQNEKNIEPQRFSGKEESPYV